MNYIDPVEYSKLIKAFTQGTTKQTLVESIEENKKLPEGQGKIAAAAPPEDETTRDDFAALRAKKATKKEGIHLGEPTGPTATTVEGKHDFKQLSVEERKQLKGLIESTKTIKQEINKLLEKARMSEGGNNTNLTLSEFGDDYDDYGDDDYTNYDLHSSGDDLQSSGAEAMAADMLGRGTSPDEVVDTLVNQLDIDEAEAEKIVASIEKGQTDAMIKKAEMDDRMKHGSSAY